MLSAGKEIKGIWYFQNPLIELHQDLSVLWWKRLWDFLSEAPSCRLGDLSAAPCWFGSDPSCLPLGSVLKQVTEMATELGSAPVHRPHPSLPGFCEVSALRRLPPQPPLHLGAGGNNLWLFPSSWAPEERPLVLYRRNTSHLPYISPGSPKYFEDGFFISHVPTGRELHLFCSY